MLRKKSFYFSCISYAANKNLGIICLLENYVQVLYII